MTEATVGMLSPVDRAAIKDVSERFGALLIGRDFAGLARLYTEDAVIMPPHLEIRKRQPDGSWLLAADIFNSDTP